MASKGVNFIEQIKEIRKKIEESFIRFHEYLQDREKMLLTHVEKLIEMEFNKKTQEIDKLIETLNTVKSLSQDKSTDNKTREGVGKLIEDQISEISNQSDHAIEFEWDLEWEATIEKLGSIKLNGQSPTSPPQAKPVAPDTSPLKAKPVAPDTSPPKAKPVAPDTSPPQAKPVAPDTSPLKAKPVAPDTSPPKAKPVAPDTSPPKAKPVTPDTSPPQAKPVTPDTSPPQAKPVTPDTSPPQAKPVAPDTFPPHVKPIVPDYTAKRLPTAYSCKKCTHYHKAPGELNYPTSLAIDYKTGNIYIADNDRVQVFSCNGDYLFMLSGKMNQPKGICISLDKVIVTQCSGHCMNVYELGGKLVNSVGSEGRGEGQFKTPHGLAVSDRNDNIYVCDCGNNRVQIFTEDLKFHSMLGIGKFYNPHDVKVTRDRVLVLDESNPCLFVFSSDHKLIKRVITRGDGKQILNPICFDIDREYNIIVCDMKEPCVYVFSQEGEQIHKIGKRGHALGDFYFPYGLALDNTGRIIVVCGKDTNCLQMF